MKDQSQPELALKFTCNLLPWAISGFLVGHTLLSTSTICVYGEVTCKWFHTVPGKN